MSILVISDVHADIQALEAILSIIEDKQFKQHYSKIKQVLNLGDTVERGYHPEEVIDKLRELQRTVPVVSLRGNHDEALLYDRPVSGSDMRSRSAHAKRGAYTSFLRTLPDLYLDVDDRLLALHGGPIDPRELGNDWLFDRSWQRIARTSYLSASGYHYTPKQAFEYVKRVYGEGYLILCGHEHKEAAYSDHAGSILEKMRTKQSQYAGCEVTSRWIARDRRTSYLIRVGIAGPEGYRHRFGLDRSYFGVIWRLNEQERIGLFSFVST